MRRALAAFALALAATAAATAQTGARPGAQTRPQTRPQPRPQAPADPARQELNLGTRAYRGGRFAEAEQHFRRALELDPEGKETRLYIARAVQQQYMPGIQTPENVAAGERAVAAYQEILGRDPADEDAYKAVVLLYSQMENEEKVSELLLQRANDFSLPGGKRAEAFATLASTQWQCSHGLTERAENKKTTDGAGGPSVVYAMPADAGDHIRARQCVTEGLQFAEQALALDPENRNARPLKANLLREAMKLAEMEGDAAQKAEYERQYREAGGQVASGPVGAAAPAAPTEEGEKKKVVVSGGVLNAKVVSKPEPEYPEAARAAGAAGAVTVQILVDEEGNVISAAAISGHPLLQQAAVAAARQAKLSPTLLSGQPVRLSGVITYNFVLR